MKAVAKCHLLCSCCYYYCHWQCHSATTTVPLPLPLPLLLLPCPPRFTPLFVQELLLGICVFISFGLVLFAGERNTNNYNNDDDGLVITIYVYISLTPWVCTTRAFLPPESSNPQMQGGYEVGGLRMNRPLRQFMTCQKFPNTAQQRRPHTHTYYTLKTHNTHTQ